METVIKGMSIFITIMVTFAGVYWLGGLLAKEPPPPAPCKVFHNSRIVSIWLYNADSVMYISAISDSCIHNGYAEFIGKKGAHSVGDIVQGNFFAATE